MATHWGLLEEPSFAQARAAIGITVKRFDEILSGVTYLIACDALGDHVVEIEGIRLAKAVIPGSDDLLRVWFVLNIGDMMAHLIHIDIESRNTGEDTPW